MWQSLLALLTKGIQTENPGGMSVTYYNGNNVLETEVGEIDCKEWTKMAA